MKRFLMLFLCSVVCGSSFAGGRYCDDQRVVYLDANKKVEQCRPYRTYKLKRPIVSRSDKKYKHIVETFEDRRAIRKCAQSDAF